MYSVFFKASKSLIFERCLRKNIFSRILYFMLDAKVINNEQKKSSPMIEYK